VSVRAAVTGSLPEKIKPYVIALSTVGIEPLVMTPPDTRSLEDAGVDGLLLTGGTDIDVALFGQSPAPESDEPDRARDSLELRLLAEARERDLPVLAICRGMQLLNVHCGGTLLQHHPYQQRHRQRPPDPSLIAHDVRIEAHTRLAEIIREELCGVNSRHHQAVDRVGKGLVISAMAEDGLIEALEDRHARFLVAVQWHPEDQIDDPRQRRLFEAFRAALSV
jgi:putative glutamine amidotransferase